MSETKEITGEELGEDFKVVPCKFMRQMRAYATLSGRYGGSVQINKRWVDAGFDRSLRYELRYSRKTRRIAIVASEGPSSRAFCRTSSAGGYLRVNGLMELVGAVGVYRFPEIERLDDNTWVLDLKRAVASVEGSNIKEAA